MGDFNSRLRRHTGDLTGKWCMHTKADDGGRRLEEIMVKHRLRAMSTYFQPKGGKAPCIYINKVPSLAPSRIDYILLSARWSSSLRSCKVLWGPSIRRFGRGKYDHGLLSAVFQHRLASIHRAKRKDFCALRFGKAREGHALTVRFVQKIRAVLDTAAKANDTDAKWKRLRQAVSSATEVLPDVRPFPDRKHWAPCSRTCELLKSRAKLGTSIPDAERREITRSISRSCRRDYREHVEALVKELEKANSVGHHSKVSRLTKRLSTKRTGAAFVQPSRTESGELMASAETAVEVWEKFIQEKFAKHNGTDVPPSSRNLSERTPPLSAEEVGTCIGRMRHGRAPGPEGIPAEAYKASKEAASELTSLLQEIWETEQMPSELAVGTLVMLHKKESKDDRKNYRAICLLSHAFKIFSMCLLHRVAPFIEQLLPDTQVGFRKTRGCRDNTCILAWTVERLLEEGRTATITYIDFRAAFDSIDHDFLMSSLRACACPEKYVRLVSLMYSMASVTVRAQLRGGAQVFSRKVRIERGVLQGDIISPLCFITALDRIFRRHNPASAGISLTSTLRIDKLEYADDVAFLDDNPETAQQRLSLISPAASSEGGLYIAAHKSFVQHIRKSTRVARTTEEDGEAMDFKFKCNTCERKFPYANSLETHRRLHCRTPPEATRTDPLSCPPVGAKVVIRKLDDLGRFDWHMSTIVRINDRAKMRVSVEYFDDEPREALRLTEEEWGLVSPPARRIASRAGSLADKLVKAAKRKAAQNKLEHVQLDADDLGNTLHFKYLGVMQSADGDPLIPVNHRVEIARSRYRELKRVLTSGKLPTGLRLRLFGSSVLSTFYMAANHGN